MSRHPDRRRPCTGELGRDAEALVRERGPLAGIRADVRTAFVPLSGRDYANADLSSADLTQQSFDRYNFRCASFRLATLRNAHFVRTDLQWADFRGATLRDASFAASDLRDADFRGSDLSFVRFDRASDTSGWKGCDLTGALLDEAELKGARFSPNTIWPEGFDPQQRGLQAIQR